MNPTPDIELADRQLFDTFPNISHLIKPSPHSDEPPAPAPEVAGRGFIVVERLSDGSLHAFAVASPLDCLQGHQPLADIDREWLTCYLLRQARQASTTSKRAHRRGDLDQAHQLATLARQLWRCAVTLRNTP
ncbi:hypothetical protein [Gloeobacter kilaueensis]|uniref:Uncharacterized protein n=1 Tax=Gloeobacter kilaueensis (strain ATCC BAA-2537 / CCAP 1431/1 / ULC 316 / JS1) TaxID=1183438 RepID=U5QCR0_GLOK1|nr:hypothetical protein [Gloeobacter kilaueensis]AGY56633.1 hypothetical protein GKIL_0386 [Gloeobacter kilaueensis JS1]